MKKRKQLFIIIVLITILLILSGCSINRQTENKEEEEVNLKEGDKAPDFTLFSQDGKEIHLYDVLKSKMVVLYFYPKDETLICTKQACTFRDSYEVFTENGAEVIGISSDSVESHKKFENKHKLPFTLLSDPDSKVRKDYGAKSLGIPGRVTFVIDKDGKILMKFSSQMNYSEHVNKALDVIYKNKDKKNIKK